MSLVDPRFVDGEAWQVAAVAGKQTSEALALASEALEGLAWSARGSWLSQEHHRIGAMPEGADFDASPMGQRLRLLKDWLDEAERLTPVVTNAASWDPRSV